MSNSKAFTAFYRTPAFVVGGCATIFCSILCAGPASVAAFGSVGLPSTPFSWLTAKYLFTSIAQKVPLFISSAKLDPKKRAGYAAAFILASNGAIPAGFVMGTFWLISDIPPIYTWPLILGGIIASLPVALIGHYLGQKYLADYAGENWKEEE